MTQYPALTPVSLLIEDVLFLDSVLDNEISISFIGEIEDPRMENVAIVPTTLICEVLESGSYYDFFCP